VRTAQTGPVTGLIAQLLLLGALAVAVGLSGAHLSGRGWAVGVSCGLIADAALARGLSRHRSDQLSPADWVTLARATLAIGVAALVADSFHQPVPVTVLVAITVVALVLDAVDGWLARRTRTATALGARFDGEVDAFLILVLSAYVAHSTGAWWVLAIGAARYAFLAAEWPLVWMRQPLPPRHWRKVVAATQGIVLTVAAADVLPPGPTRGVLVVALGLIAESFGRDVWWLWRNRLPTPPRERLRPGVAAVLTILALALVWIELVAPNQPSRLTLRAFARLPLEGIFIVGLALALPARARRLLAWVAGPVLGLLVIVKVLDMGFFATFDRPFDPVSDWRYAGIGTETLRDSIGRSSANLAIVVAAALAIVLFVLTTLAVLRLTRVAAAHRRWSLPAVAALAAVWGVCWLVGAQFVSGAPIASTSAAGLAVHEVRAIRAGIQDHAIFARQIARDRFRGTPGNQLLTGLRGKDVIVAFVESYGKVAVQNSSFSPRVDAVLDEGTRRLQAAGFSSRSAFLTSSTFGGISWLAHSTLQSGVWVNTQRRYDQLVKSDRFTLSRAFKRAGWRTVDEVPSNNRAWPPGSSFYHYDKVYDRRYLGYRGPTFAYASMPDQYVLAALQRLELRKRARRPLFAEVDLVSSHTPWTRIPHLIDWSDVGDGSIYNSLPVDATTKSALWSESGRVRAAYGRSIEYTLNALVSFVQRYGDDNLVLVVLGDHQPATIVTGQGASHDVPISIIAHDPAVLNRIANWGWGDGLRPGRQAPVWPMSAFRDRFLRAFGSRRVPA
jgi:phosphatidylglycerophosphate synthase